MFKRIAPIAFIFICCTIAWVFLGGTVVDRTQSQDRELQHAVGGLWGGEQVQQAPSVSHAVERVRYETREAADGTRTRVPVTQTERVAVPLASSVIAADVRLEHRRKGLLWYPTYAVDFAGDYGVLNDADEARELRFALRLPSQTSVFGGVELRVDGEPVDAAVEEGAISHVLELGPGESARVRVGYASQGTATWRYDLRAGDAHGRSASGVATVRDFSLALTTDFDAIDFPPGTLSPTTKRRTDAGWALSWDMGTLVTDAAIGMAMPQRLNPGPWVSRVTFFAPVSLFLFFFVLYVLTLVRGVRLHPIHYFFLGAGFFAFHLLLAYLVDHVHVAGALAVASVVSLALVVSYMRLVTGLRFALVEVGLAQAVYLVGFACTFFLEGFTGLAVTLLSVATLFIVMQTTGRIDWEARLASPDAPADGTPAAAATPASAAPAVA